MGADLDGFSLHAAVRVAVGDRKRLELLCRYAGRPVIAESRLSLLPDRLVAYSFKKTWRDGSTHVLLEPQVLIERLLALVRARPQRIVPQVAQHDEREEAAAAGANVEAAQAAVGAAESGAVRRPQRSRLAHRPGKRSSGRLRCYRWASWCAVSVQRGCGFRARTAVGFAGCFWRSRIRTRLSGCCGLWESPSRLRSWPWRGLRRKSGVAGSGRNRRVGWWFRWRRRNRSAEPLWGNGVFGG